MSAPPASVHCPRTLADRIRGSARRARPREACGVLGGLRQGDRLELALWVELPSDAPAQDAFAVDPVAFAIAEAQIRCEGLEWLGFAHSHPDDRAEPSTRDLAELWRGCLQVIAGGEELQDLRAFWLHDKEARRLHWEERLA